MLINSQRLFRFLHSFNLSLLNFCLKETAVLDAVSSALKDEKLDAVICVAGGWAGGNAKKGLNSFLFEVSKLFSNFVNRFNKDFRSYVAPKCMELSYFNICSCKAP